MSYESLVQQPGDVLNGIFNVAQINGISGITYNYSNPYLMGTFTGFVLDTVTPIGTAGFHLTFTGGALNYYSNATNLFAGTTLTSNAGTQAAAIAAIQAGTLELSLTPQLIDATHTLYIDILGGLNNFAAASTSAVYLDITGGASAGLFYTDSFQNSFTGQLADALYQGSANTTQCGSTGQPVAGLRYQSCDFERDPRASYPVAVRRGSGRCRCGPPPQGQKGLIDFPPVAETAPSGRRFCLCPVQLIWRRLPSRSWPDRIAVFRDNRVPGRIADRSLGAASQQ